MPQGLKPNPGPGYRLLEIDVDVLELGDEVYSGSDSWKILPFFTKSFGKVVRINWSWCRRKVKEPITILDGF